LWCLELAAHSVGALTARCSRSAQVCVRASMLQCAPSVLSQQSQCAESESVVSRKPLCTVAAVTSFDHEHVESDSAIRFAPRCCMAKGWHVVAGGCCIRGTQCACLGGSKAAKSLAKAAANTRTHVCWRTSAQPLSSHSHSRSFEQSWSVPNQIGCACSESAAAIKPLCTVAAPQCEVTAWA
jgi:hypothetical protein